MERKSVVMLLTEGLDTLRLQSQVLCSIVPN